MDEHAEAPSPPPRGLAKWLAPLAALFPPGMPPAVALVAVWLLLHGVKEALTLAPMLCVLTYMPHYGRIMGILDMVYGVDKYRLLYMACTGVLCIGCGIMLYRRQSWARTGAIMLALLLAGEAIYQHVVSVWSAWPMPASAMAGVLTSYITTLVELFLYGMMIFIFMRPPVLAWFGIKPTEPPSATITPVDDDAGDNDPLAYARLSNASAQLPVALGKGVSALFARITGRLPLEIAIIAAVMIKDAAPSLLALVQMLFSNSLSQLWAAHQGVVVLSVLLSGAIGVLLIHTGVGLYRQVYWARYRSVNLLIIFSFILLISQARFFLLLFQRGTEYLAVNYLFTLATVCFNLALIYCLTRPYIVAHFDGQVDAAA